MHAALGTEGYELLSVESDRKANRCTAACLDARSELRAAILGSLAESVGTRRVAQAFNVSREVVRALKKQALESGELDQHKQRLGMDALALASATIDRISDELDDMPRASLPIVAGVMIDKAQILTGGATQRIVHEHQVHDINDLIDSLPSAESVPVETEEIGDQKGRAVFGALPGPDVIIDLKTPAGDSRSLVSCPSPQATDSDGANSGQTDPKKESAA